MSLLIPGRKIFDAAKTPINNINKNVNSVFGCFNGDSIILTTHEKTDLSILNGNSLPPAIVAISETSPSNIIESIKVKGLVLIQDSTVLTSEDWQVHYAITFDSQGGNTPSDNTNSVPQFYKILIYLCYNQNINPTSTKFNLYAFDINFSTDAIPDQSGNFYPLESIKTVEVFVLDKDPKTSRGTVTTVTQPTNGS
ncbi:hypothetical protein KORDIASMS9_04215 [Kordia sp. SMS9]|uniref:hypothetical protein n=1 Tax=Kordia sp. SMS9 TaxID=2282170 RepID=UPI000E0D2DC7|nr:hypothetical protein [Kordia sp. SMS9]AXG71957.1 hypothetical protein KORDIASMS9_04215 [Kordia sp. SMS9]